MADDVHPPTSGLGRKLQRIRELPGRHRVVLIQAWLMLPALRVLLRLAGLRRVHAALERSTTRVRPDSRVWSAPGEVQAVAQAVEMAARHLPVANTCLHRSLTLWWLLRRRGIVCDFRVGARRGATGFDAHAWVEHQGTILNDDPGRVDDYSALRWADRRP